MGFLKGVLTGLTAVAAGSALLNKVLADPERKPLISEYAVRSVWMHLAGFDEIKPNPPLLENTTQADVVIIGGGFTGLAAAYHLSKSHPNKRIILLEAARCGYGGSGRNGGILQDFDNHLVMVLMQKKGLEAARTYYEIDRQGPELVRTLIREHQIDCDLEECGVLELALNDQQMETLQTFHRNWKSLGIDSRILDREEVSSELKTDRFAGGLHKDLAAILNPAKLAHGLKTVVESQGVEVYERTRVMSIKPGSTVEIETEFGSISTPSLVLATNAYTHQIGFFKERIFPLGAYAIATEPLDRNQLESIGWQGREAMWDMSPEFFYTRLTADNRILIGGESSPYFYGNGLSTGNYKPTLEKLEKSLLQTWPQLNGIQITHKWGGTLAMTLDYHPTIGVMGENRNIFYGLGYSGHGVSWSQLAGKIISQLYSGDDTELTRFYCVNRKPPYLPPEPLRKAGFELYTRFMM